MPFAGGGRVGQRAAGRCQGAGLRRALIALDSDDPVVLPAGKKLWWTATADDHPWEVQAIQPQRHWLPDHADAGRRPHTGQAASAGERHHALDAAHLTGRLSPPAPQNAPWTHRPAMPLPPPEPIDAGDAEPPPAAVDGTTVPDPGRYV